MYERVAFCICDELDNGLCVSDEAGYMQERVAFCICDGLCDELCDGLCDELCSELCDELCDELDDALDNVRCVSDIVDAEENEDF